MIPIAFCVVREKLRRKDVYIVALVGIIILISLATGNTAVSGSSGPLTGYRQLVGTVYFLLVCIACALSVALSLSTIPNEYKRSTSHLVWVRGVSQANYHTQLTIGNLIVSFFAYLFLHLGLFIFMAIKGGVSDAPRLLLSIPIGFLPVAIVCVITSGLSILLPTMAVGLVAVAVIIVGAAHTLLMMTASNLGGILGPMLRFLVNLIPNIYGMASQAGNALKADPIVAHTEWTGLLALFVVAQLLWALRKKEA